MNEASVETARFDRYFVIVKQWLVILTSFVIRTILAKRLVSCTNGYRRMDNETSIKRKLISIICVETLSRVSKHRTILSVSLYRSNRKRERERERERGQKEKRERNSLKRITEKGRL